MQRDLHNLLEDKNLDQKAAFYPKIKKPPVRSGINSDGIYKRFSNLQCMIDELLQNRRMSKTEHIKFVQLIEEA